MKELKSISSLLEADKRWSNFVQLNMVTNEFLPITLDDRYRPIAEITLSQSTPDNVKSQFNVALMLGVYAWLYYPFHQLAELKAYSTVEMALRIRFPFCKGGLKKLLNIAVKNGVITDKGFSHISNFSQYPVEYSEKLPEIISTLRNNLAHGSETLHPGSLFTLKNCSEIINQLFLSVN
jgi:hypothetical protein